MEAVKYLKERQRFIKCNEFGYNVGDVCKHELEKPENAVRVIENWSAEHPQKTYAMDFFEKFPNAIRYHSSIADTPMVNFALIHGNEVCEKLGGGDTSCWITPMEVEE